MADGSAPNFLTISGRFVEAGPRRFSQKVDTFYLASTLDGKFAIRERDWFWNVNAVWSENHAHQVMTGNINAQKLTQALGPIAQCTAPCVPMNIFGGPGTITPEMLNFVQFVQRDRSDQTLADITVNISGSLFDLPAGPLGIAIGYEFRDSTAPSIPIRSWQPASVRTFPPSRVPDRSASTRSMASSASRS